MKHDAPHHRASKRVSRWVRASLAVALATAAPAWAGERTLIVLDGSGSMWGRIDGTPKLEIARATLADVLADMPADAEIGLMAYGHNRKGDCDDIEMLVPPRAGAAPDIIAAAGTMRFLGMTPLTAAVTRAAEALRHTEQKATVVLVTDGLETCDLDPCAAGRDLEAAGVDFTAHVVGFGLDAEEGEQVACLATATGGSYFAAADASTLADALDRSVVATPTPAEAPAPAQPPATLDAPARVPMGARFDVEWVGPGGRSDFIRVHDPGANHGEGKTLRQVSVDPDQGNVVRLVAPTAPGEFELQYFDRNEHAVLATRPIVVEQVEVSLVAQDAVPLGSRLRVEWTGPGARNDDVRIVDPAANHGEGKMLRRARVDPDAGREVVLVAPTVPGEFELQYFNRTDHAVLATRALRVDPVEVSLAARDVVPKDTRFRVEWVGPGAREDYVRIVDPDANHGDGKMLTRARVNPDQGRAVDLVAPAAPGDYELQYFNRTDHRVLATRPLRVD